MDAGDRAANMTAWRCGGSAVTFDHDAILTKLKLLKRAFFPGGQVMRAYRVTRQLIAAVMSVVLCQGCADFFPSFSGNFTAPAMDGDRIPAADVINSVQCELADFLAHETYADEDGELRTFNKNFRLKEGGLAKITLHLNQSFKGGVSYTKIDVTKSDLLSLFLIPGSDENKIGFPGLEVSGTGTTTADIESSFTQSRKAAQDAIRVCYPERYDQPTSERPEFANSSNVFSFERLQLKEWLDSVSRGASSDIRFDAMSPKLDKITLTTSFVLFADLNSSIKRLIRVVPIDNFPIGRIRPELTHKLTITLEGGEPDVSEKQPSTSDCLILHLSARSALAPGSACAISLEKFRDNYSRKKSDRKARHPA